MIEGLTPINTNDVDEMVLKNVKGSPHNTHTVSVSIDKNIKNTPNNDQWNNNDNEFDSSEYLQGRYNT